MNTKKLLRLILTYVIVFFILILFVYYFDNTMCILKRITGLSCPACGNTRAIASIIKGDFLLPIKLNLMFYPEAIITCLAVLYFSYVYVYERNASKVAIVFLVINIVLFIFWGILRNIIKL